VSQSSKRTVHATPDQLRGAAEKVAPYLEPLLEHVLTQEGRGALAARAIVGTYLPQIHLLARDWLLKAIPRLFEGGTTTPLQSAIEGTSSSAGCWVLGNRC